MKNKRVLIVTNSVYQLLTSIHMKRTILKDCAADLLITDIVPQSQEYVTRFQDIGLFDRVFSAATKELNQKYAGADLTTLNEGFLNIHTIFQWSLSEELAPYDAVYFSNFDPFLRMLACIYYIAPCEFICFEDGFSSYVINFLRENRAAINRHPEGRKIKDKLSYFLLYEPHLAMRGDGLINRPLPKINRNDRTLIALLNEVFDYHPPEEDMDFIFLEQSFRAEGIRTNDIDLMRECQQAVGPGKFVVKPHPRNPEHLSFQLGLTRKFPGNAPWELFLLNEDFRHKTILTVCSNAALTGRIVLGMDVNTVMLYKLFEGKVLWQEDEILKQYLQKFQKQFAGQNYYVPQTIYELRDILKYLGGQDEQSDQSFGYYPGLPG